MASDHGPWPRAQVRVMNKYFGNCYPETVHRIYVINSPTFFSMIWKVIRTWVDPVTAEKLQVISTRHARALDRST